MTARLLHHPDAARRGFAECLCASSVVGYTQPTLTKGTLQNNGVCFMNTTGTDIDIQQIKALSGNNEASDGTFRMRWFNAGRYDYAVWSVPLYDPADPEEELDYNGWGDLDEMCPITKTFPAGGWFLVTPTANNPSLQVAGALVTADSTRPTYATSLNKGSLQMCGNPFPTTCDIQAIVARSGDAEASDGTFRMRWFNAGRYDYAVWSVPLYDPADPEEELDYNGWGDLDEMCPITKTFGVGEGFLVTPTANNPSLVFPNPLYSAGE